MLALETYSPGKSGGGLLEGSQRDWVATPSLPPVLLAPPVGSARKEEEGRNETEEGSHQEEEEEEQEGGQSLRKRSHQRRKSCPRTRAKNKKEERSKKARSETPETWVEGVKKSMEEDKREPLPRKSIKPSITPALQGKEKKSREDTKPQGEQGY